MRCILDNIRAGTLDAELQRRGIAKDRKIRVVVETLDDLPLAQMAEEGGAFRFLADEPDLYSEADIRSA